MEPNYPQQLGDWVRCKPNTRRDRNLTAFLEARDDVRAALAAGYAIKTIWSNMREAKRIPFGYDAFLHYVHRHVQEIPSSPSTGLKPPANATAGPRGFTFNPSPNKEELL